MSTISNAVATVNNWWWFIIKGILFLIAGIAIFTHPVEGYVGLSLLFSIVILCAGISQIFFSVGNRHALRGWGWTLASGILDVVIGVYLLTFPVVTLVTLPFIVGFWLMFRSFYLIGASIELSTLKLPAWGWLLAGGIVMLVVAFLVLYYPGAGMVGIVAYSGAGFILGGILNIALAFQFRQIKNVL